MRTKKSKRAGIRTGQYQSLLEKRIAKELKKGMSNVKYEDAVLSYVIRRNYVPDFICTTRTGKTIYIETKGYYPSEDRTKMRAVKASYPDLDIRLVFDKNNKVSSRGKMRYLEWAEKWGFKAAVGSVPTEWFYE